jgi:hypothetical protein
MKALWFGGCRNPQGVTTTQRRVCPVLYLQLNSMKRKSVLTAIGGMLFMLASQPTAPVQAQPAKPPSTSIRPDCGWRGTAPFCAGECEAGEEGFERTAHPPEGPDCATGTKILCCRWPPPTPREIRSMVFPNRCLDADTGTIAGNGTKVQLWDCWGGPNQKWLIKHDGTIVNAQSGRCLDADTGTIGGNGTKVQLWDCAGGPVEAGVAVKAPNQYWFGIDLNAYYDGNFPPTEMSNLQSHRCLDADLPTITGNGTKVQLWDCWGGQNQKWTNYNPALPHSTLAPVLYLLRKRN